MLNLHEIKREYQDLVATYGKYEEKYNNFFLDKDKSVNKVVEKETIEQKFNLMLSYLVGYHVNCEESFMYSHEHYMDNFKQIFDFLNEEFKNKEKNLEQIKNVLNYCNYLLEEWYIVVVTDVGLNNDF